MIFRADLLRKICKEIGVDHDSNRNKFSKKELIKLYTFIKIMKEINNEKR